MRTFALGLAAAAAVALVPATAFAYDRPCGGTIDVQCYEYSCRFVDCFRFNCLVYVDATHNGGNNTVCVPGV